MPTVLVIRSLSRSFHAGVAGCSATVSALRRVSLRVETGECVAVCGPSGVGKSTLLLCAAGLLRADSGTVRHGGRRGSPVAYVGAPLPPLGGLTVAELLEWEAHSLATSRRAAARRAEHRSASDALALADASHLGTVRTRLLSTAAARRVAVARALLASPRLLVIDEPHAGVAPAEWPALESTLHALARAGVGLLVSARVPAMLGGLPTRVVHLTDSADARRYATPPRRRLRPRGGDGQGAAAWRLVAEPPPPA